MSTEHPEDLNWERIAKDLHKCRTALEQDWALGYEELLARYSAGACSAEERSTVERLAAENPEIAEILETVGLAMKPVPLPVSRTSVPSPGMDWLKGAAVVLLSAVAHVLVSQKMVSSTLSNLDYWDDRLLSAAGVGLAVFALLLLCGVVLRRRQWIRRLSYFLPVALGGFMVVWLGSLGDAYQQRQAIRAQVNDLFLGRRWVTFDPPGFNPYTNEKPSEGIVRQALLQLQSGSPDGGSFDGLITFNSEGSLAEIPRLAREAGFKRVIMGIYLPRDNETGRATKPDADTWDKAIAMRQYVDAYCLGHNDLQRTAPDELARWMAELRHKTGRPVTTSARLREYLSERGKELREIGDFYFPDVAGSWRFGTSPRDALMELQHALDQVMQLPHDKPVLLKMVSYPSGGRSGMSENAQAEFFSGITQSTSLPEGVYLSIFNATDIHWKTPEQGWDRSERHVGLYSWEIDKTNSLKMTPKKALAILRQGFPIQTRP